MGQIRLNDMEFYAWHGCYPEEQRTGNTFVVNLVLETGMAAASESDRLDDALDYAEVYALVKREMAVRSHLLEHLSGRIVDKLLAGFPQLDRVELQIAKLNPPVGGPVKSVSVLRQKNREIAEKSA